jgi:hypothetical protein
MANTYIPSHSWLSVIRVHTLTLTPIREVDGIAFRDIKLIAGSGEYQTETWITISGSNLLSNIEIEARSGIEKATDEFLAMKDGE